MISIKKLLKANGINRISFKLTSLIAARGAAQIAQVTILLREGGAPSVFVHRPRDLAPTAGSIAQDANFLLRIPLFWAKLYRATLIPMSTEAVVAPAKSPRPNWLTLASIGALACLAADMVHEALGHGTASWITGDRILSISTVAMQNGEANRFVSAAGTSANCIAGALSLLALRRVRKFTH